MEHRLYPELDREEERPPLWWDTPQAEERAAWENAIRRMRERMHDENYCGCGCNEHLSLLEIECGEEYKASHR